MGTGKANEVERLWTALEKVRKLTHEGRSSETVANAKAGAVLKEIHSVSNDAIEWIEKRRENRL